jgi:hypothetical protein
MEIYLQGLALCHGNRTELITHRTLGGACEQPYAYQGGDFMLRRRKRKPPKA